jgi:hypothetical protein
MLQASDIAGAEKVSLTIAPADRNKLTRELQLQIGDRPVIELGLKIDGKTVPWRNKDTAVTVSEKGRAQTSFLWRTGVAGLSKTLWKT